jgi:hypothetical protein
MVFIHSLDGVSRVVVCLMAYSPQENRVLEGLLDIKTIPKVDGDDVLSVRRRARGPIFKIGTKDSSFPTSLVADYMVHSLQKGGTNLPLVSQLAVVV